MLELQDEWAVDRNQAGPRTFNVAVFLLDTLN